MFTDTRNFDALVGGSHTSFKNLDKPPLSNQDHELQLNNESKLQEGVQILRKLRTLAVNETNHSSRQNYLKEAHQFSTQMADVIIGQSLSDKPTPLETSFLNTLQEDNKKYVHQVAGSAHAHHPQFVISNLFQATKDILVRINEKAGSYKSPNHKLTEEETKYVLQEFLVGTNCLSRSDVDNLFKSGTKVGGILSGGSVYLEVVKKIIEKYSNPSLSFNTFVIAVDKGNKRAVFETAKSDADTQNVIITDDMIDKGGTILTALWNAGEHFPKATIYCGKGVDYPGSFEDRRVQKHEKYLFSLFQDFADLSEKGKNSEALKIFDQAERYAKENNIALQPGWHIRKQRIENSG